ncbi:MAG: helix-turn-helix transcriptional regulator [Christensenellaceae bacterium]|jgi:DNA-binding Xre family transcriptional regulator|nr:helix-turn-helix transcriptional regulator [Christensenellaceae bacterium]
MTITQAVKQRLKELAIQKNISFYRLVRIGAISPNTGNKIMAEEHKSVNLRTVLQFASALGITPSEFFDSPLFTDPDLEID